MIDPQLAGKVVLITGANHGIGAATARSFAAQGAHLFLSYYRPPSKHDAAELAAARAEQVGGPLLYEAMQQQRAEVVAEEIRCAGGRAIAHEADLGDAANIERLFDLCEAELGPVDVLVNNHTYCVLETFDPALVTNEGFPVHMVSAREIDAHFSVNARAYDFDDGSVYPALSTAQGDRGAHYQCQYRRGQRACCQRELCRQQTCH